MRGSPSPAGRGARRAQPADNASTASFATSSIKPQQRSHRMSHTLDLDPCLARYTIITVLFFSDCFQPRACSEQDNAVCRPSLHPDLRHALSRWLDHCHLHIQGSLIQEHPVARLPTCSLRRTASKLIVSTTLSRPHLRDQTIAINRDSDRDIDVARQRPRQPTSLSSHKRECCADHRHKYPKWLP